MTDELTPTSDNYICENCLWEWPLDTHPMFAKCTRCGGALRPWGPIGESLPTEGDDDE